MSTVDDIKAKIDLADYLREQGVQLKPAGASLKACCPFHNEKTPSFMVSREKQVYYCFGCFIPGTLVKTPHGFHRIEMLQAGERVIAGSGSDQHIVQTHGHTYEGDLVGVRVRKLGGVVYMTHDHRVPVVRGATSTRSYKVFTRRFQRYLALPSAQRDRKLRRYFPVVELPAEQLRTGDLVMYPIADMVRTPAPVDLSAYIRTRARKGPKPPPLPERIPVDHDLLRFVGLWIAEGSSHRAYVRFSFGPTEMRFAEEVQAICRRLFGLSVGIHVRGKERSGIEVTCCHAYLAQAMEEWCGKGAEFKHLPFELQDLPPVQQRVILDALCDGDGTEFVPHRSRNRHRSYTTISRTLAEQVVDVVLRCGYFPTLSTKESFRDANGVHHRDAYTVQWSQEARQKYCSVLERGGTRYWLLPIVSIERKPYHGPVYNLTVDEEHSYIATNFIVANCGKGGDLFTFVQEREGLEFGEALKLLAERAGVRLEVRDPRLEGKKTRALAVLELAAKWFRHQLEKTTGGDVARAYVAKRRIAAEIAEQFQIGYAPDVWDELSRFLAQRGFSAQEILEAGLAIQSHRSAGTPTPPHSPSRGEGENMGVRSVRVYDRFRHRLMFPIHDAMGRVVGFTGRILDGGTTTGPAGETVAKYVNTPETTLYKKGAMWYGLLFAKEAIRNAGFVALVEGQMDVIACHEAGIANTIAASGTALTFEQLRLLKRYTTTLHIAFDADPAGEGAAERGIDAALDAGFDVRVIRMPTDAQGQPMAKDADECVRKDADAWRQAVAHPVPVLDYFIERVRHRFDLRVPAGQRDAGRVLVAHLAHIADPIERAAWVRRTAESIGVPEDAIRTALGSASRTPHATASESAPHTPSVATDAIGRLADRFLALVARYPEQARETVRALEPDTMPDVGRNALYLELIARYDGDAGIESVRSERAVDAKLIGSIERLELFADHEFSALSADEIVREIACCAQLLRRRSVTEELHSIAQRLRTIERSEGHRTTEVQKLEERSRVLTDTLATIP